MITELQEAQLTGGAECFVHFHPDNPLTQSDGVELQAAATQNTVTSATYTATSRDDYILCDTTATNITITLPLAGNGREYEVVKVASANSLTILPTAPDTVLWSAGVLIYNRGTALRLKATSGNWMAI